MLINKKIIKANIAAARERIAASPNRDGKQVDMAILLPLAEMAALDIAPDGTFSDVECIAWEAMRYAIQLVKEGV